MDAGVEAVDRGVRDGGAVAGVHRAAPHFRTQRRGRGGRRRRTALPHCGQLAAVHAHPPHRGLPPRGLHPPREGEHARHKCGTLRNEIASAYFFVTPS
eukprot:536281-Prorocentrum_minimum.AAC.1